MGKKVMVSGAGQGHNLNSLYQKCKCYGQRVITPTEILAKTMFTSTTQKHVELGGLTNHCPSVYIWMCGTVFFRAVSVASTSLNQCLSSHTGASVIYEGTGFMSCRQSLLQRRRLYCATLWFISELSKNTLYSKLA